MRLCLINPVNPLALSEIRRRWFHRYRIWKPLGLLTVAALTPSEWEVQIIDENVHVPDYQRMPRPDVVGITAFTSQATRAYDLAGRFRKRGIPVVMGGIHASMRPEEAAAHVDAVVTGEAERIWPAVLDDVRTRQLRQRYEGPLASLDSVPPARHDLLAAGYAFGVLQTTRGCPLNCSFCSVTAFNGAHYRNRPIAAVVQEMRCIQENLVLIVDDNLIGTSAAHLARAKALFRAIIEARLKKRWICQVTINLGDDDELLALAAAAGCVGVFIGFESPTPEGLGEVGKKFNIVRNRDLPAAVKRIQRHGILVVGSFILGLDSDTPGIGRRVADTASAYGLDILNALFLTPLPGTRVWEQLASEGRIRARAFPDDWRYYTLTFPVADYRRLSQEQIIAEMDACDRRFYSPLRILRRVFRVLRPRRHPLFALVANLSYRSGLSASREACRSFARAHPAPPARPPTVAD